MGALAASNLANLLGQWFWFKLDETAGTTIVDAGNAFNNGGTLLWPATCTIRGTTAAIFANAGAITPFGDNWNANRSGTDGLDAAAAQALRTAGKDFFDCSTLCTSGHALMVAGRATITAAPSGDECVISSGGNNGTEGGSDIRLNSSAKFQWRHRPAAGGVAENFAQLDAAAAAHATMKTFFFVVDGINKFDPDNDNDDFVPVVHVFDEDGHVSSQPMTAPVGSGADGGNHGIVLFGLSGLATPSPRLNQNGSGIRLYDLAAQRVAVDLSTSWYRMARDWFTLGAGQMSSEQAA